MKGHNMKNRGPVLQMPQGVMMAKFKVELIKIVLSVVKQLLVLPEEKRALVLADLETVVQSGDLSKLPGDIQIV
jgi:hypothetical protein